MENNKYTDLDNLFRNRLYDRRADGAWMEPSDDVFVRAMETVNRPKRRRYPMLLWWLVGISGIMLLLLAGVLRHNQKLDREIQKYQSQIAKSEEDIVRLKNEIRDSKLQPEIIDAPSEIEIEQQRATKAKADNSTIGRRGSVNQEIDVQQVLRASSAVVEKQDQKWSGPGAGNTLKLERINSKYSDLTPLFASTRGISWQPIRRITPVELERRSKTKKHRAQWLIESSVHLTALRMTNLAPTTARLTKYDDRYLGQSVSLGMEHRMNERWSWNLKATFLRINNESDYRDDLTYDKGQESSNPFGQTIYKTRVAVLSPMVGVEKDLEMNVDGLNINDRDNYLNHTVISERHDLVSLAGAIKWNFVKGKTIEPYMSGGLSLDYLLSTKENLSVSLYHQNNVMTNETFIQDPSDRVNRWSVSTYAEAGFNVRVSRSIDLGVKTGWRRSLTPINVLENGTGPHTYLDDLNIGVGVKFKL